MEESEIEWKLRRVGHGGKGKLVIATADAKMSSTQHIYTSYILTALRQHKAE